ncbi:DUF983 domain-containing protein [Hymenobacter algoricola]|uniref:DUF983 domain-containing protein n=1 Tax=Hymenobacter algoricola TaxID=486267 RepID=A0ABP7NKH7_9BACT
MPGPQSVLRALLAQKCPRCHLGRLFTHSAFNLAKFDEMPAACPVCGQTYEPEVGFYWGAMYISYGFSVGIVVLTGVLLYFLAGDPAAWVYILTVATVVLGLTPVMFRYSRTVMLYFFGGTHYDAAAAGRLARGL